MRAADFMRPSIAALVASFAVLAGVQGASAGYIYRDGDGVLISTPLAMGLVATSAASIFYPPSYYPAYVYPAPPVAYAPLPYDGPAVVYGRPLLAPEPYYPAFYPYVSRGAYYGYLRGYRY